MTVKRIYLETMEDVLRGMNKVLIDESGKGSGVVPYLPLPELERRARERAQGAGEHSTAPGVSSDGASSSSDGARSQ